MKLYEVLTKLNPPSNFDLSFANEAQIIEKVKSNVTNKSFNLAVEIPSSFDENKIRLIEDIFCAYEKCSFKVEWKNKPVLENPAVFLNKNQQIYEKIADNYLLEKPNLTTKNMLAQTAYRAVNRRTTNLDQPSYQSFADIEDGAQNVVLHGEIIKLEIKTSKTKRLIYILHLSDYKSSIKAIYYGRDNQKTAFDLLNDEELARDPQLKTAQIKEGDWIAVRGRTAYSSYDKEIVFTIDNFKKIATQKKVRTDVAPQKRAEFHIHTKMSVMDGVSSIDQFLQQAHQWDWPGLGITDHANVQAYPNAFKAVQKINQQRKLQNKTPLKLVYGVEMNMLTHNWYYVKNPKNRKLNESRFVVFDLETTGLSPENDEVIEFGATLYDYKTGKIDKVDWLYKSHQPLKQFTKNLTKITDEMLANKPFFEADFKRVMEFIEGATLIAHNARFDLGFLQAYAQRLGYPELNNTVIDTLSIARALYPDLKSHRLGSVAKKVGIIYDEKIAHRGDYDAEILSGVFERMWNYAKQKYNLIYDHDWNQINPLNQKKNPNWVRDHGFHTTVLAKNQQGLKELYRLISLSHTQNLLGSPKVFRDDLRLSRMNNNLLIGSGCVNGEIFEFARTKTKTDLIKRLSFYDYIEVQPLSVYQHLMQNHSLTEAELKAIIRKIINTAQSQNILVIASSDAHYVNPEEKIIRDIYINAKGLGGKRHPLFNYKNPNQDNPEQHLRTTEEMLNEFAWLGDQKLVETLVIKNPLRLLNEIEYEIAPIKQGTFEPKIENVDKLLRDKCQEIATQLYGNPLPSVVSQRLNRELEAIIKHGYGVVYWISHLLVKKSLDDGYLVGSRGSVGSSLVARLSEITEVNPLPPHYRCPECRYSSFEVPSNVRCGYDLELKDCPQCKHQLIGDGHDIPFETFLGYDGDKTPDIDLNFSSDYQAKAHAFVKEMFGENNAFRAGTISTVAEKTAFGYVKAYFEERFSHHETRSVEIERLAKMVAGVKRTSGQHPGGIIILPKDYEIEDFTPINYPADDDQNSWKTTHFDFTSIHDNLLKMDILGHVDPTALKMLHQLTGIDPLTIPMNDHQVYSLFTSLEVLNLKPEQLENETTGAIGLPEFGTNFVRNMLRDTKPRTFADLVQISGLSHGTDVWVGNAQPLIKSKKATISTVIGCRDDIMVYLIKQGLPSKDAFTIMEAVRKGQGLKPQWIAQMTEHQVPQWYIEACERIKYMFPKAHATAYVLMAYRIAWYKIHYPTEYYATFFTTRPTTFDLSTIIQGATAIRSRLQELIIKANQKQTSAKENESIITLEVALEMAERGIEVKNIDVNKSLAKTFMVEKEEKTGKKVIYAPFNVIESLGEAAANSIVKSRSESEFKSIEDLKIRTQITQTQLKIFKELEITNSLGENIQPQLSFSFF